MVADVVRADSSEKADRVWVDSFVEEVKILSTEDRLHPGDHGAVDEVLFAIEVHG